MKNEKTMQEMMNEIIIARKHKLQEREEYSQEYIIQYIGKGRNIGKDLFRIIEKYYSEDDKITKLREAFYEYENEPVELPLVRNEYTGEYIRPTSNFDVDGRGIYVIDAKSDIERNLEQRQRQLVVVAKSLGIEEDEIESLSEIDLEQKVAEKKENEEKDETEQEDGTKKISEEEAKQIGITGMNSVRTDVDINAQGNTLGKALELEEYEKLMVVHSYKLAELTDLNGEKGSIRREQFAFVGQKRDGTYEIIPETKLRPYRGANNEITEINDNENVEVKREECIFEVPETRKRIAIDQKDPYGIPEVYYGESDHANEGNVMQNVQDERDGTSKKSVEVRSLFNSNRGEYQIDRMEEEAENHPQNEIIETKDADGNEFTVSHIHEDSIINFEGQEARFEILAKTIAGCQTQEEIEELLNLTNNKVADNSINPEMAIKQAIEERNNTIIQNSYSPEKVKELMEKASVKNPNNAIKALEEAGWDVELAENNYNEQYRNLET